MAMLAPTYYTNLTIYLNQWVKVASGDRVKLISGIKHPVGSNSGYLVFKCVHCQDNWNVGLDHFQPSGSQGPVVPSVLQDWVKKHRHVCKKYQGFTQTPTNVCFSCKWPYGAHDESWMEAKSAEANDWGSYGKPPQALNAKQAAPETKQAAMQYKQFTG